MQYKRTHVPTGAVQTFRFNDSHHECFSYCNVMPKWKVKEVADFCVKAWNEQHPDMWQYELELTDRQYQLVETEDAVV